MPSFGPRELDILSRALERAMETAPQGMHDPEHARRLLISGLYEAAEAGERNETALTAAAIAKLALSDPHTPVQLPQANL
jgi:hypothetical protein